MTTLAIHRAKRVRIYINESDHGKGVASPLELVEFLRKHNAAGASVTRCDAGFGSSGRTHTRQVVDLSADLPVVVEWIDNEELVAQLLPELLKMVRPGLVTVDDTTLALCPSLPLRDVSSELAVAAAMTRDPIRVEASTPLREVIASLNRAGLRALPVVDAGIPIGMITSCDLVNRAGYTAGIVHSSDGQPAEPPRHGGGDAVPLSARDVMTSPVVTIPADSPLSQAATVMVRRRLKRLPAVDDRGLLVGIVSRLDLLRTIVDVSNRDNDLPPSTFADAGVALGQVMRRDVPVVFPHARIPEVLPVLVSTRLNLALVVDAERRVVGLITAAELLQRVTPDLRHSLLTAIAKRLPFFHPPAEAVETDKHAGARVAAELMTGNFEKASTNTPLNRVIATMVGGAHKVIAVVDDADHLLGIVDRADVLRGLLQSAEWQTRT